MPRSELSFFKRNSYHLNFVVRKRPNRTFSRGSTTVRRVSRTPSRRNQRRHTSTGTNRNPRTTMGYQRSRNSNSRNQVRNSFHQTRPPFPHLNGNLSNPITERRRSLQHRFSTSTRNRNYATNRWRDYNGEPTRSLWSYRNIRRGISDNTRSRIGNGLRRLCKPRLTTRRNGLRSSRNRIRSGNRLTRNPQHVRTSSRKRTKGKQHPRTNGHSRISTRNHRRSATGGCASPCFRVVRAPRARSPRFFSFSVVQ